MALSEQERLILEQMEAEFRQVDPELASALGVTPKHVTIPNPVRKISATNLAIGLILAVLGLILPIVGITIGGTIATVTSGIAGFTLMVYGILYVFKPAKK